MRTPALHAWRAELARAARIRTTFDALWRAACQEINALEHASFPTIERSYRVEAQRIIREAAKQQRAAA